MPEQKRAAFSDAIELWERAAAAEHGIRLECPTEGIAINTAQRLNRARKYDRELNADNYPQDHPLHRCSVWDTLAISRKGRIVEIRPGIMQILRITELGPNLPPTEPVEDDDSL